jgi:hypothetical protein
MNRRLEIAPVGTGTEERVHLSLQIHWVTLLLTFCLFFFFGITEVLLRRRVGDGTVFTGVGNCRPLPPTSTVRVSRCAVLSRPRGAAMGGQGTPAPCDAGSGHHSRPYWVLRDDTMMDEWLAIERSWRSPPKTPGFVEPTGPKFLRCVTARWRRDWAICGNGGGTRRWPIQQASTLLGGGCSLTKAKCNIGPLATAVHYICRWKLAMPGHQPILQIGLRPCYQAERTTQAKWPSAATPSQARSTGQ